MQKNFWSSSSIAILGSIIEKVIGIVSTAIVARILTPSDFGIIAIGLFFYELCSSLGDLGTQKYLLRQKNLTSPILNQTFTFRFLTLNLQAIFLALLAPFLADFFQLQHLLEIIYVYSFTITIKSFQNIYFFKLYADLEYLLIVKIDIIVKLISSLIGILLAFFLENFYALIYSQLLGTILLVVRTYIISDEKPAFDFSRLQENWRFSKWLILETLIGYMRGKFDTTLTATYFNISVVGKYDIARSNGQLPLQALSDPLSPILISKFSLSQNDCDYNKNYLNVLKIISLFFSPLFIVLYHNVDFFIYFLLGNNWLNTIVLFKLFLVMSYFSIFNTVNSNYYISKGDLFSYSILNFFLTVLYIVSIFLYATTTPSIELFTLARISFIPIALFITIGVLNRTHKTPFKASIFNIIIFLIFSFLSYLPLTYFEIHNEQLYSRILSVICFIIIYFAFILLYIYTTRDEILIKILSSIRNSFKNQ